MNVITSKAEKEVIGIITILSGFTAFSYLILSVIGINYNFDVFSNPVLLLTTPGISMQVLRWSMIANLFGYYLFMLPVIFFLHEWMKTKTSWYNLITFCGAAYIFTGALGISILISVLPRLFSEFLYASPGRQTFLLINFQMLSSFVFGGVWNILEILLGGVWWLSSGVLLKRWNKALGYITMILGTFTFLNGIGTIFEIKILSEIGLSVYLFLAPIWAIYLGIILVKKNKIKAGFLETKYL